MAKFKAFKKVAALVTAIALVVCFAVSASAEISVVTTTTYSANSGDVTVSATVTGTNSEIAEGVNVTYYALNADGTDAVHIDQQKAAGSSVTFTFDTAETNLKNNVKVGYTAGASVGNGTIAGYTVTCEGETKVVPTGATSVKIPYTPADGQEVSAVTLTSGTVVNPDFTFANNVITITFDSISSDATFDVAEGDAPAAVSVSSVQAAAVLVGENVKIDGVVVDDKTLSVNHQDSIAANADKKDDRKITVMGKVAGATSYGVIVSATEADAATRNLSAADFAALSEVTYACQIAKDDTRGGLFAVQLIDTSDVNSPAFIAKGTTYYTAIYAVKADGSVVVTQSDDVVAQ